MRRYIEEISNFEMKAKNFTDKLVELRRFTDSELNHIKEIALLAGINESEIDSLIYHLRRGEIIETDRKGKFAKLTLYGHLMREEKIKIGYAPI
ncbi:MAG: hypothetical protein GTN99_03670 [Candidatus Dadabacteria bacterium]|nr:hypothetical protein [Candidatus Dadabacteria bacterium]NIT13359.1 hypothetical protein [Candidatus Dadabacteria bacterium]